MFPSKDPAQTTAWKALLTKYESVKNRSIPSLFKDDDNRFDKYSVEMDNILFDWSKSNIDDETASLLLQLAEECELKAATEAMFNGEKINQTEDRAVLHTALRSFSTTPLLINGKDVLEDVRAVRVQMKKFVMMFIPVHGLGTQEKK